jgi:hypothetical protein
VAEPVQVDAGRAQVFPALPHGIESDRGKRRLALHALVQRPTIFTDFYSTVGPPAVETAFGR